MASAELMITMNVVWWFVHGELELFMIDGVDREDMNGVFQQLYADSLGLCSGGM